MGGGGGGDAGHKLAPGSGVSRAGLMFSFNGFLCNVYKFNV